MDIISDIDIDIDMDVDSRYISMLHILKTHFHFQA